MIDKDPVTLPDDKKKDARKDDADLLDEARERFNDVADRDKKNRDAAKEDTEFVYVAGEQWDKEVKKRWGDDPTLEFPQLKQFVNQVVNDQRQNRPGIQVHPAGGHASTEVAEIIQGLCRHIEYDSQAEAIYDNGFQAAVVGGRGYWRIVSEYEGPKSFNQNLKLKPVDDPLTVYLDPDFQMPDGSDASFGFVTESLSKDEFEEKYPDAEPVSWEPKSGTEKWYVGKDRVIVADYYRRVCRRRTLLLMSDGNTFWKDELPHGVKLPPGVQIEDERESEDYEVEWYKIAGGEQVLKEEDWPGTIIPIVCCMGDLVMIDGKRIFQGLIRQARDAQRMYNYEKSMKAVLLSLAPLAPYLAAAGAISGYENMWKNANKARYSTLVYNDKDENGNPIPPPQRTQFAPVPTGLTEAAQSDKDDIKSIIGMYQNSLGQHGQETSGRAILARQKQGDNATFHFADNMSRAIALTGRILLELIPFYYDTKRLVTVIQKDDTRKMVVVNDPATQVMQDGSVQAILNNDLSVGEYAVTVEAGPSYATAREQTRESLMALVQADPQVMAVAGDIIVGAMDFPDAEELSERLKLMLPPPIQQHLAAKDQGEDPKVAALNAQLAQQGQQMQQLQQQAQQAVQQAQQAVKQAQAERDGLKAQMASQQGDQALKAQELQAKAERDARELAIRERAQSLAENEFEATTVLDLIKLQQTQTEPVGPQAAALEPVADALVEDKPDPAELMGQLMQQMQGMTDHIQNLTKSVSAPRKNIPHRGPDGLITHVESVPI